MADNYHYNSTVIIRFVFALLSSSGLWSDAYKQFTQQITNSGLCIILYFSSGLCDVLHCNYTMFVSYKYTIVSDVVFANFSKLLSGLILCLTPAH